MTGSGAGSRIATSARERRHVMRLTVTSHLTLDGVMQSNGKPEPELNDGFEQGGWQVPYFDQDLDRLTADWIAAADAFLAVRISALAVEAQLSHVESESIFRFSRLLAPLLQE